MTEEHTPEEVAAVEDAEALAEALAEREAEQWDGLDPKQILREKRIAVWESVRDAGGADLLAVDTSKPTEWVPGAERIIRARERQSWIAKEGEGKTQAAVHLAVQVVEDGGRVIYVDVENDPDEMAGRLQAIVESLGDEARQAVAERLAYLPDLNLAALHGSEELMKSWIESLMVSDLLIVDSLSRVLSMCGKDENSNTDFADWMLEYIDPIVKYGGGIAVLLLDNMGHEATHARGAINKGALVEAVYAVSGGKNVSPTEHGTLTLKRQRTRSGLVAKHIAAGAGGDRYERLEAQEGDAPKAGAMAEMEERRGKLESHLRGRPEESFSVVALMNLTGKTRSTIKQDMQALIERGTVQKVQPPDGERGDWWRARCGDAVELSA